MKRQRKAVAHLVMEHKIVQEFKLVDEAKGEFEGYLAVFNNEDYNGDVCEPGCFKRTLQAATEVKERKHSQFLFPLLFMHKEDQPAGGFYEMKEDKIGLFVRGRCDLNTELGRMVFSGMREGYISQMSIGYNTVRSTRDQKGVRHLWELRLWEGSAITTGYAANADADVLATKGLSAMTVQVKGACGKSSWPIGDRNRAWDGASASDRIAAWATGEDNKLDVTKMKSVHFWFDPDAADTIGGYKLPFCDIVDGNPVAMPSGIEAVAGALQGSRGNTPDIPSGDVASVKSRVASYYRRMARQFKDDSLVAPWNAKKLAIHDAIEQKQMAPLQLLTYCLSSVDDFGDYIDSMLEKLGDACGMSLDPDEGSEDADVGEQLSASEVPGMAVHATVRALLDNIDGLPAALLALGNAFQAFDDATDTVLALLGMEPTDYMSEGMYGMMAAIPQLNVKVNRQLSAANRDTISKVMQGLMGHHDQLKGMLESNDSGGKSRVNHTGVTNSEPSATTPSTPDADSELRATTQQDPLAAALNELYADSVLTSIAISQ